MALVCREAHHPGSFGRAPRDRAGQRRGGTRNERRVRGVAGPVVWACVVAAWRLGIPHVGGWAGRMAKRDRLMVYVGAPYDASRGGHQTRNGRSNHIVPKGKNRPPAAEGDAPDQENRPNTADQA